MKKALSFAWLFLAALAFSDEVCLRLGAAVFHR
jgi:hypothetical protein